jgi:galactan endo-1,6-beta-galactosidase
LGLNIVKYNAGANGSKASDIWSMETSPNIHASNQTDRYWLDWESTDPSSPNLNWNIDYRQPTAMLKAKMLGANHFQLFSNSSMWWMLYNHNPSGADDGGENIQSWNLQLHAKY